MHRMTNILKITFAIFLYIRFVVGEGCLTTQNDTGAVLIRTLQEEIDAAECRLVKDTIYTDYNVSDGEMFDFLVIGAGSAGCVVANRLSENPNWTVLLLEAGGDPTITDQIPGLIAVRLNSEGDWQYKTEPEPSNCLGCVNKSCPWPLGKMLGGSSELNAMIYVRGHPNDFNNWGDIDSTSWKYKDMLHYFKKSEDMRSKNVSGEKDFSDYHSVGGYLKVDSFKDDVGYYFKTFSEAFKELNLRSFYDVNANEHEGLFTVQGTVDNGRRCSTANAFLRDFQSRPNLKISKNSFVSKVLIDEYKTAYGVEFTKAGKLLTVTAAKEVIVCCGTINSPQLLMLSGIGPQRHLEDLGINVIQNLKVGYNLQDHPSPRGVIVSLDISVEAVNTTSPNSVFEFLVNGKGGLTGISTSSIFGFIKTSQATYPNIQLDFLSRVANSSVKLYANRLGFNEEIQNLFSEINLNKFNLFLAPTLLQPKSRGRLFLRSHNPREHPIIYPGYLSDDRDMNDILEAISFVNKFVNTRTMIELGAAVEFLDIPECRAFEFQSDSYWKCIVKFTSVTAHHPVGTCKMGPRLDSDSVVDPELQVIGIHRLRVIDASIMPNLTNGNTNAPTIAIAEKGSDLIKLFWGYKLSLL